MKFLAVLSILLLSHITDFLQGDIPSAKPGITYGKKIKGGNAIKVSELTQKLETRNEFTGKIEGTVVGVCKKKGCFMKLERENGEPIMITFKDYAIFMPQDIVGRTVVVEGTAKSKETSVEQQRHFAQDAGKSSEEIAKITKPMQDIEITAEGVLVVK